MANRDVAEAGMLAPDKLIFDVSPWDIQRAKKGCCGKGTCTVMLKRKIDEADLNAVRQEILSRLGADSRIVRRDPYVVVSFSVAVVPSGADFSPQGAPCRVSVAYGRIEYEVLENGLADLNKCLARTLGREWTVKDSPACVQWNVSGSAEGLVLAAESVSVNGMSVRHYVHDFSVHSQEKIAFTRLSKTSARPFLAISGQNADRAFANRLVDGLNADPNGIAPND